MSLVIPSPTQKVREIPDSGYYNAVCVDAVNLGLKPGYNGEEKKKCCLVFELDETDSDGRRFILYRTYTVSLHERSSPREDLESWRNKPFTDEELSGGFDLEKVVGQSREIRIIHKQSGENTYVQIETISPAKTMVQPSEEYTRVQDR